MLCFVQVSVVIPPDGTPGALLTCDVLCEREVGERLSASPTLPQPPQLPVAPYHPDETPPPALPGAAQAPKPPAPYGACWSR